MRAVFVSLLVMLLPACGGGLWNNPYPAADDGKPILYSAPPLQYHYLKRPYQLVPLAAAEMPAVRYLDKQRHALPDTAPAEKIAFSVYEIRIKPGMRYQPHPAFARNGQGGPEYDHLTPHDLRDRRNSPRPTSIPLGGIRQTVRMMLLPPR